MRPSTIGDLLAKRNGYQPAAAPTAPPGRVTRPWWMDPAGLRGSRRPAAAKPPGALFPERVPPDP
jgi:hypothetical protein